MLGSSGQNHDEAVCCAPGWCVVRPLRSRVLWRLGAWRSLVAHTLGVRVVAGSNPAAPTRMKRRGESSLGRDWSRSRRCGCLHSRCLAAMQHMPYGVRMDGGEKIGRYDHSSL